MKRKNLIKTIAFLLIFTLLFSVASRIVTVSSSSMEYQWMKCVHKEPQGSLDAVYIGSSNVFAFWNQNIAWQEYGITVYPYCCSWQPFIVTEYMIKEARKTHPDSLYIVNVNTLGEGDEVNDVAIHYATDYLSPSLNKIELTEYLCDVAGYEPFDRLEFYFPLLKSSRWSGLTSGNFKLNLVDNSLKAGNQYSWYLESVEDIADLYVTDKNQGEISDTLKNSIDSLLDYCDSENLDVLFVTVPRGEESLEYAQKINTVNKIISERGYKTLDLMDKYDEMHIDLSKDYYNINHTNIHGSIKYTYYLAEYLIEEYGLEDKRGESKYTSWDSSWDKYNEIISPYILDFELDFERRTFNLKEPDSLKVQQEGSGVKISWEAVEGADAYAVYKKVADGKWIETGETKELSYSDSYDEALGKCLYRVVPVDLINGEKFYGEFYYKGVAVEEK